MPTTQNQIEAREHSPRRRRSKRREYRALRFATRTIICLLLTFIPWAVGGSLAWAWPLFGIGIAIAFGLWGLRSALRGKIEYQSTLLYPTFGLIVLVVGVQGWQGASFLRLTTLDYPQQLAALTGGGTADVLSLVPGVTADSLLLALIAVTLFVLVLNVFDSRHSIVWLAITVIAIGTTNGVWGLVDLLGTRKLFWYLDNRHNFAVTGTFLNKNHFALLLEIALPIATGLILATYVNPRRPKDIPTCEQVVVNARYRLPIVLSLMVMLTGLIGSFSRAGILLGFGAVLLLISVVVLNARRHRHRLILPTLGIVLGAIAIGSHRLEQVGQQYAALDAEASSSVMLRYNLSRSTLSMIADHWLWGIGAGAYKHVSPHYEDGAISSRIAGHAHNDLLQLPAELGVPVSALLYLAILWALIRAARQLYHASDPTLQCIGAGAIVSVMVVIVHSGFDFGLRSYANLFIAISVLALAMRCGALATGDGNTFVTRSVRLKLPQQFTVGILGLLVSLGLLCLSVPKLRAGAAAARLQMRTSTVAPKSLLAPKREALYRLTLCDEILRHAPRYIQGHVQRGQNQAVLATDMWQHSVASIISGVLGRDVAVAELSTPLMSRALPNVAPHVPDSVHIGMRRLLEEATTNLSMACRNAPSNGLYPAMLARNLERSAAVGAQIDNDRIRALYDYAHARWPHYSRVTMMCSEGYWQLYSRLKQVGADKTTLTDVVSHAGSFSKLTLEQNPRLARDMYRMLWGKVPNVHLLYHITPDNMICHEQLYRFLFKRGLFQAAANQLERMREYNQGRPLLEEIPSSDIYQRIRTDPRDRATVARVIAQEQSVVQGLLGNWDARQRAAVELRRLQQAGTSTGLTKANHLYASGRYRQVVSLCNQVLGADSQNVAALVLQARAYRRLGDRRAAVAALSQVLYLEDVMAMEQLSIALELIDKLDVPASHSSTFPLQRAVRGGLLARQGQTQEAIRELRAVANDVRAGHCDDWLQMPSLYFWLGTALERTNNHVEALATLLDALHICPEHLASAVAAKRLAKFSDAMPTDKRQILEQAIKWLDSLPNEWRLGIQFGGKARLMAYDLHPRQIKRGDLVTLRAYWLCTGDINREYLLRCQHFIGNQRIFEQSYPPRKNGSMLAWRVGQLVVDEQVYSPVTAAAVRGASLYPGTYNLHLTLVEKGTTSQRLSNLADCRLPGFRVR